MRRIRKSALVLAALLAASTSAGCKAQPSGHSPHSGTSTNVELASHGPVVAASLSKLPPGVFYILAGPHLNDTNVWQIASDGTDQELTHNPIGDEIDSMAASPAGIILADSLHSVDQLAQWTENGPNWLHPFGHPRQFLDGQVPAISSTGELAYELPPAQPKASGPTNFTIWVQDGLTGRAHLAYQQHSDPGEPAFGPHDQLGIAGPVGEYGGRHRAAIVYIAHDRIAHRTTTKPQGYPAVWGPTAPAIVIPMWKGPAIAYFADGRTEDLPAGWQPLAWNTAGSELLVRSGTSLGIWRSAAPATITKVGASLTSGFTVLQVNWLNKPAPENPARR